MPAIISTLLSGLLSLVGTFVGRVLLSLGLGFVEYQGIKTLMDTVTSRLTDSLTGLTGFPLMLAWAGFFRIDVIISLMVSAIGVKLVLMGLQGNTIKKLIRK